MDGLTAKRILIALANMLGFDSVRRANLVNIFTLKLVKANHMSRRIMIKPIGSHRDDWLVLTSNSSKWTKMLNRLIGKEVSFERQCISDPKRTYVNVYSIEQLIIDLELDGYLKTM